MNLETKVKNFIKEINISTYVLLVISFIVYSPFIIQQLNSADVNVYGYTYHADYGYENALGRFFIRIFDLWRNSTVSVVLVIPVSILLGCLSVELLLRIFGVKNNIIAFFIGSFVMFPPAMANLYSYAYTADSYCFALFLAVLSAYILTRANRILDRVIAIIPIVVLTGIYQAYLSVAIFVVTIYLLQKLLCEPSEKNSWKDIKGDVFDTIISYVTIIASLVVYLVIFKILDAIGYLSMDAERGSDNMVGNALSNLGSGLGKVYKGFYEYFFTNVIINNSWFGRRYINIAITIALVVIIVLSIIHNKIYKSAIRLIGIAILLIVIPVILCLIILMAPDASIYAETGLLMMPCIGWFYIIPLLWVKEQKRSVVNCTVVISGIMVVVMIVFIQCFARLIDLEQRQFSQLANRIVYSVESMEDFEYGEKLLVMGRPQMGNYPLPDERLEAICRGMISHYSQIFGAEDQIANGWITALNYYVGVNYERVSPEERKEILSSEEYKNMDIYPSENAVKKIGDIVVVKLSTGYEVE